MNNNKFIALYNSLDTIESNRFEKYLLSPYFNADKNLVVFYKGITKILKSKKNINKEKIWSLLFKNIDFNNQKYNRLLSDISGYLEDFITIENFKSNKLLFNNTKLEALNKYGLDKSFSGALRTFKKNISQAKTATDKYYYTYKTERSTHDFLYKTGGKFKEFTNLSNADSALDAMYITIKLQNHIEQLFYINWYKSSPMITISSDFLRIISDTKYQKNETIKSFYLIQDLLTTEDDLNNDKFNKIYDILENKKKKILYEDKKTMFQSLINYCIIKINEGQTDFYKILFNIYKIAFAQNIFHENNILNIQSYKNIITVGLYILELEWIENFIKNHSQELQDDLKENALNYNLAKLAYKKKEYDKVISLLNLVTYDNINYALGTRMYLLRTYFEMNNEISFESMVFSFSAFIKRNKDLSQQIKKQYLNFIKNLKSIYYLNPYDKEKATKLKDKIENLPLLVHKPYLLEQWELKINPQS